MNGAQEKLKTTFAWPTLKNVVILYDKLFKQLYVFITPGKL